MANIIIPKEANRRHEAMVLKSFAGGKNTHTAADREAAAIIAARSREAVETLKKMEGKRK